MYQDLARPTSKIIRIRYTKYKYEIFYKYLSINLKITKLNLEKTKCVIFIFS